MPQLKGLIFDLDGTLVDSAPDLRHALNATLAGFGRRALTPDEVKQAIGDGMMPMLNRAFAATGGEPPHFDSYACFQTFINHYRNLKPDAAQIYPEGHEILKKYHGRGVKIGLCTNKQEAASVRLLEQLDLAHYFAFISGGDTFQFHKPHPDHVRGVMRELGVEKENCVMVGDGPNDVRAAHGAGILCIVVTHGYSSDYSELGADRLIGGLGDLERALGELGFKLD